MNRSNFSLQWQNFSWKNEVNEYQNNKMSTFSSSLSPTRRVTHQEIKTNECFFNPITQKYLNNTLHEKVKSEEKNNLPNTFSRYYDKNLRYEQTFNIINLKDKLSMFKSHYLYPHEKQPIGNKKVLDMSKIEYNILSNQNLKNHHFDKPENRPNKPSTSPKYKPQLKQVWTFKDYDIISNKYNENHEKKLETNELTFKMESAKKYWRNHDFDSIVGKFYDQEKENKYQTDYQNKAKIWGKEQVLKLPKKVREEGLLYNPVNKKVLDQERLEAHDLKMKNKKKRYEKKNQIEEYFLKKDIYQTEINEKRKNNKKCYEYYREEDNRGYDILNFDKNFHKYKSTLKLKDHKSDWDVLKEKADKSNDNENYKSKVSINNDANIYKHEYDYSDVNKIFFDFKTNRSSKYILIKKN